MFSASLSSQRRVPGLLVILLGISLLVALPACDVAIVPPNDNGSGGGGAGDGSGSGDSEPPAPVPDPTVTLDLANRTGFVVEAQIFISTNGPGVTPETFFVDSNAFTEGIGLASSGLMAPDSVDVADIKCGEGLVIGTTGGRFLEVETGDEVGVGPPRILQEGLVFDCGSEIALVFRLENGQFTVSVTLE